MIYYYITRDGEKNGAETQNALSALIAIEFLKEVAPQYKWNIAMIERSEDE